MDGTFSNYAGYGQGHQPHPQQQQQGIASFGSLSAQAGHQDSPSHQTLPPLQNQNGGYAQFGSLSFAHPGSQAQTPTTPHTPSTSSMQQHGTSAYSTMSPVHQQGNMMPPSFNHGYGMTQSSLYPSSTATAMPPSTSAAGLPSLRPMPPGGVGSSLNGLPSLTSNGQIGQQVPYMHNEEAPTHVVGSQGRRGILPSAPGRPNPPPQGSVTSTKSMIPQKDADGKYPCPHCNKTYLHAKHLKRHLLRHTGDRPYMCHLCKDTFSRSDILKRHFQKCSIRRGNPTGANHLAHQRRNTNTGNRMSMSQQEGPIGLAGLADVAGQPYPGGVVGSSPTVNGDMSGRSSRANSLITPGSMSHRNSIAGLGILGSNAPNGDQMGTSAGFQQSLPAYAMHNASNGGHMQSSYAFNTPNLNGTTYNTNNPQQMSFLGHQSSRFDHSHSNGPHQQTPNGDGSGNQIDWTRMFSQGGQDGFIGSSQPANASSQGMHHIKTESDGDVKHDYSNMQNNMSNESFLGSLYSHPGAFGSEYTEHENGIPGFPNWSMDDPWQGKVDSLIQYCFPGGTESLQGNHAAEIVQACLTVGNVKHFSEHYTSFHGHWPIVHMPTFKLTDANNALVLAMICMGAVYSSKLDVGQVRQMMDFLKATVTNNSSIYNRTMSGETDGLGNSSWDVEELQALLMLQIQFTWHGDPNQRQMAREEFPTVVRIAKAMGLCHTAGVGHYAYSVLHSGQNKQMPQVNSTTFSWNGWLEQEKRNRVLYLIFLTDAAMVMYFNSLPQFNPLEIRLMLPADDAAWDARDQRECASALGLNGVEAQRRNITGTRRSEQPGMREAMRTLLEPSAAFQPSATNCYAKFVLVHALITRIIACQKTLLQPDGPFQGINFGYGFSGSGPATPLSQNDWLDQHGNGTHSGTNSGHATPTDGLGHTSQNMQAQQEKLRLGHALDKWKRAWDNDMEVQYPPGLVQQRRFGFSRDGVHFFYLGRSFLQSLRAADWTVTADARFKQVMSLLKRIKGFVVGDNETKGHEIGSVGDIDDQYGLDSLTLDMKLLFKPYNSQFDSPVAGVQTYTA
ncbi:hypothetical protein LTR36_010118 [Oleoguttula mirabilis]|uniref:C2H2-type domain-containing protein n=1 Tax=Oleoguttula mirabilis TaxID=1507867 RepID=A0AAV9JRH2_9PEZI|nr:hypothetical protein LTR36_010118 [Oleoguttula mirabilis]